MADVGAVSVADKSWGEVLSDTATSLRRALLSGDWLDTLSAAGFAFLSVLVAGAILLLAVAFQYPDVGAQADPAKTFTGMVILGLAALRVPFDLGGVEVSGLAGGALIGIGLATSWATKIAVSRSGAHTLKDRVAQGARVALPFALLCFLCALIFTLGEGESRVRAVPGVALILGALWGGVFGAIGGLRAHARLTWIARQWFGLVQRRRPAIYEGAAGGFVMLLIASVMALTALLIALIAALAFGPRDLTAGGAVAGIVYVVAFAPNLIATILALAVGAPIEVGAQVTVGGRVVGELDRYSVFNWDGLQAPIPIVALVLIPVVACIAGGVWVRRRGAPDHARNAVLGVAALTFSLMLGGAAWLSEARLGAGLVRERGVARVAPQAVIVLVFALVWALAMGLVGWYAARGKRR